MKKQIFTLFSAVLLVAVITGCGSTQDQSDTGIPAQETSAAVIETPMLEGTEPAVIPPESSDLGGEDNMAPTEEIAVVPSVEPVEPGLQQDEIATAEPPIAPTEPGDMMAEEPETTVEAMPATTEPSEAPQAAATTDAEEVLAPTGSVDINRLSNLVDFEVWNRNNEQVGEVDAIIINQDSSQIEYVVVGVGGFLELGEKEVPVPWQAFQLNVNPLGAEADDTIEDSTQISETPQNVFILDADQDRLEQAPDIDLSTIYEPLVDIENQADDQTQETEPMSFYEREQEIQSFWQSNFSQTTDDMSDTTDDINDTPQNNEPMDGTTTDGAMMTTHLILADDLLGATLVGQADVMDDPDNAAGETDMTDQSAETTEQAPAETQVIDRQDLGEVQEALVDTQSGKITYLLVSLNDIIGPDEEPGLAVTVEPLPDEDVMAVNQWVFVPLQAVSWDTENEVLVYTGTETLEQAPAISEEEIQNGVTTPMTTDADSFWGVDVSDDTPTDTTP